MTAPLKRKLVNMKLTPANRLHYFETKATAVELRAEVRRLHALVGTDPRVVARALVRHLGGVHKACRIVSKDFDVKRPRPDYLHYYLQADLAGTLRKSWYHRISRVAALHGVTLTMKELSMATAKTPKGTKKAAKPAAKTTKPAKASVKKAAKPAAKTTKPAKASVKKAAKVPAKSTTSND